VNQPRQTCKNRKFGGKVIDCCGFSMINNKDFQMDSAVSCFVLHTWHSLLTWMHLSVDSGRTALEMVALTPIQLLDDTLTNKWQFVLLPGLLLDCFTHNPSPPLSSDTTHHADSSSTPHLITNRNQPNSVASFLLWTSSLHTMCGYLADKFSSLGGLHDVRTVSYGCVVQASFGIFLVGNLWSRAKEQTECSTCQNFSKHV